MIPHLIAGLGAILVLRWLVKRLYHMSGEKRRRVVRAIFLYGLAIIILFLVLSGRLHWLFAVCSAALPWFSRVRYARRMWHNFHTHQNPTDSGSSQKGAPHTLDTMDYNEALQILGLEAGASREEIITAHRRLIAKVHPDRGGSAALAQRINTARKVLLKE